MDSSQELSKEELIHKIQSGASTVRQAEKWLAQLKRIDPYFDGSDVMLQLKVSVKARRKAARFVYLYGWELSSEQLIEFVGKIRRGEGTEVEVVAWEMLIQQSVVDPDVLGYIHFPQRYGLGLSPSAEEIVEKALSYQPILLGPSTSASNLDDSSPHDSRDHIL